MNKEVKFKAVNSKVVIAILFLFWILLASLTLTGYSIELDKPAVHIYFTIAALSAVLTIVLLLMLKREKNITMQFGNNEMILKEESMVGDEKSTTISYRDIKNYNIYPVLFLFKKTGSIVRIKTKKNYNLYINQSLPISEEELTEIEYDKLNSILDNKLDLNKKTEPIDILIQTMVSFLLPAFIVITLIIVLGLFIIYVF